jgi:hypothetical protein
MSFESRRGLKKRKEKKRKENVLYLGKLIV